jgi:hypothetical protein
MVPGDTLNATLLTDIKHWDLAWDRTLNPSGIVIAQNLTLDEADNVRFQVEAATRYLDSQFYKQPSLIYVDEGHDFFGGNAMARYGTALQRCYRAGAEQGMSSLLGAQRPKTITMQTLTESNLLYLFRIKFAEDVKRLREMGAPPDIQAPVKPHRFRFMRDDDLYPSELKVRLPSG